MYRPCDHYILSRISIPFGMLSVCTGQVTHALLTRPPLTWLSLGFKSSPFDLHVLGTPPAFILSQDQTLMLKVLQLQVYPASCYLAVHLRFLQSHPELTVFGLWVDFRLLTVLIRFIRISLNSSRVALSSFFRNFSGLHYCLFVKVLCCLSIYVSATTSIRYHI